jgi:hypothetical protein
MLEFSFAGVLQVGLVSIVQTTDLMRTCQLASTKKLYLVLVVGIGGPALPMKGRGRTSTVICSSPTVMGQYGPDKVPVSRKGHTIDAHYCWIIVDHCVRRPHYSSWGL